MLCPKQTRQSELGHSRLRALSESKEKDGRDKSPVEERLADPDQLVHTIQGVLVQQPHDTYKNERVLCAKTAPALQVSVLIERNDL